MFLTTRAKEVKTTKTCGTDRSSPCSESGDLNLPLVRPAFSFDAVLSTSIVPEKCPETNSKGLEFHVRRCRELHTINQQLNERLIQSELQKEDYRIEMEFLKHQLAEALKIPSAMLFPRASTQATTRNSVQKLRDSAQQRAVLTIQVPERQESGNKGVGVKLRDLEERVRALESMFVQELDHVKSEFKGWSTGRSEGAHERSNCVSFDEQRLKEVSLCLENFTLLVRQNAAKLQALFQPVSPQRAFISAQHTSLREGESWSSTSDTSLESPTLSETDAVLKSSPICGLRKEDGVTKTQNLKAQGGQDSVNTLQNQTPQISLHAIKSAASPRMDINDSARTLEDYRFFSGVSPSSYLGTNAETRLQLDAMTNENSRLRREIIKISEELVDVKEHSITLEADLKEQRDASVHCKVTERNLRRAQDLNRDLNNALFRKQKIIASLKTVLTNLRSEAKQHGVSNSASGSGVELQLNTKICAQVDAVLDVERSYSKMDRLITKAQTERDCLASRLIAVDGQARRLQRKYARNKREIDAMQKENSSLKRALSCARSEIRTLQTNLRVETMKLISQRRRARAPLDLDDDMVMKELVKTKIALAQMHGVVIELRKDIFKYRFIGGLTRSAKPCSSQLRGQYSRCDESRQ